MVRSTTRPGTRQREQHGDAQVGLVTQYLRSLRSASRRRGARRPAAGPARLAIPGRAPEPRRPWAAPEPAGTPGPASAILQIRPGRVAHVQFLVLAGEVDVVAADRLAAAIAEAAAAHPRRIVFDLSAVSFADSTLVHGVELARKLAGEEAVVVVGARPGVARLLAVCGCGQLCDTPPALAAPASSPVPALATGPAGGSQA